MSLIQVRVCDHCSQQIFGPFVAYRVEDGPVLDMCSTCEKKPFKRVQPSARATAIGQVLQMALRGTPP